MYTGYMLDKIKKHFAYVKSKIIESWDLVRRDIALACRRVFTKPDGMKTAIVAMLVLSAALYYLPPDSWLALMFRDARLWAEANIALFLGAILILLFFKKFRGTLRALILGDGRWKAVRISLSVYILALVLAWFSGTWPIPDHPYYYLYVAVGAAVTLSLLGLSMVTVSRLLPVRGALAEDEPLASRENLGPYQLSALDYLEEILQNQQQINSVGLYGDWGTGKTSIYMVAKKELSTVDSRIIWVEIEPWRYTSQEALVLGFYEQIGQTLEKEIPGIQNTVNSLLSIAEPLVRKSEPFGIVETIYRWFNNLFSKGAPTPAEYISRVLEREGRYLVVAIDNVERTGSAEQVYRTLQLVHFLKDARITYVFISEKDRLLDLIGSLQPSTTNLNMSAYLEKFIEYEIDIFRPSVEQLSAFFTAKLNEHGVPGQLVDVSKSIIKNFETYRGVIKILNLFVFELDKRFLRNGEYTIDLSDKLQLDYLRSKYPPIWAHIEKNRDYYDEGLRDYDQLKYFTQDDDDRKSERRQAVERVISGNVPQEKVDDVRDILKDLFPTLKNALDNSPAYKDSENWLLERRVAAPYILDEYFARNESLVTYDEIVQQANSVLDTSINKGFNSNQTANYLKDFLRQARNRGDARNAVRLLVREIFRRKISKQQQKQFFRALLRVYASNHKTRLLDEEAVMAGILVGINQLERGLHDKPNVLKADLNYIFSNLWMYGQSPSFMLRLLLFISPGRNNDLYNLQDWGGPTTGYQRYRKETLNHIKSYYDSRPEAFQQLFGNIGSKEWSFVYYQWGNGIVSKAPVDRTPEEQANFTYVNQKFLSYLKSNPEVAYECLRQDFYIRDTSWSSDNGPMRWMMTHDAHSKYEYQLLMEAIEHLIANGGFSSRKQSNLAQLKTSLQSAIDTQEKQRASREAEARRKARMNR